MICRQTGRGFRVVLHEQYPTGDTEMRLIQESSAIGDYDDSLDKPGSSFLWVGQNHHLNREQVQELITRLQMWLDEGRLALD